MYNKKLIGFFLIALILAVCIGTASASENATLASVDEEKTFTDIQKQIDAADENTTIELEGEYTSQGKKITIKKPVTITSKNGATLNAKSKSSADAMFIFIRSPKDEVSMVTMSIFALIRGTVISAALSSII